MITNLSVDVLPNLGDQQHSVHVHITVDSPAEQRRIADRLKRLAAELLKEKKS